MAQRRTDKSRWHRFYRRIGFAQQERICVYCGARGWTVDHFVPLSVIRMLSDVLEITHGKVLFPCCGECNSIAGARLFPTVAAKRRYIQGRLRQKYDRVLNAPIWRESEINELDYNLRSVILAGEARRQWVEARLRWSNRANVESAAIAAVRLRSASLGSNSALLSTALHGMRRSEQDSSAKPESLSAEGGKA